MERISIEEAKSGEYKLFDRSKLSQNKSLTAVATHYTVENGDNGWDKIKYYTKKEK